MKYQYRINYKVWKFTPEMLKSLIMEPFPYTDIVRWSFSLALGECPGTGNLFFSEELLALLAGGEETYQM